MHFIKKQKYRILPILFVLLIVGLYGYWSLYKDGTFEGRVTKQEDCFVAIGTSQCTWIVGNKRVEWMWGSALENQETGEIRGFNNEENIVGRKVRVRATPDSFNNYKLSEPTDYIQLID